MYIVLLPETVCPAVVPTYCRQLYKGVKVLVRLGNEKNIFTAHVLPYFGCADENLLTAKRRELDFLRGQIEAFSGDVVKRAGSF